MSSHLPHGLLGAKSSAPLTDLHQRNEGPSSSSSSSSLAAADMERGWNRPGDEEDLARVAAMFEKMYPGADFEGTPGSPLGTLDTISALLN